MIVRRLDRRVLRNLGLAALAWFLALVAATTAWWVFEPVRLDAADSDFTLIYIGARIGLERGWSNIYSLDLLHQLFTQLRPLAPFGDGERFVAPPPMAWLVAPLTAVGIGSAYSIWLALSVMALVAAWWLAAPGLGWARGLWLLGALAWYPILYSLALGQPAMVILLVVVAGWRLADAGRPYLAGAVLGLSVLKPQLVIALPVVLLVAGRWRITIGWAITAGILAAASILVIGGQGLDDYRRLLAEAQTGVNNRYYTLAYIFGPGPASYAAQAVVVAAGLAGAYLNRRASLARLFALGIVLSALGAGYWHVQDYAILAGAAWLYWRDEPPAWQRGWLLVVAVAGELAWPLRPLPILIAMTVWLVMLCVPRRRAQAVAVA